MTDPLPPRPSFALAPPARVGMAVADVDTPALLLDLDAFEANLAAMTASLADTGIRLRPHAKSHKCPEIARRQIAAGAVGICCQKASEAEAFIQAGIGDVLVANEVVGDAKLRRLARLAGQATLSVCVDHADAVRDLEAAMAREGARVDVLVEVDVGASRCGVEAGPAVVTLARLVADAPHLRFAGLQGYQGSAQHVRSAGGRRDAIATAGRLLRECVDLLRSAGLDPRVVTGGGTGTYLNEATSGVYTEVQAGSYIFMDADYARNLDAAGKPFAAFRQSLFVLSTVMSRPTDRRAVVDVGLKAHSVDSGMPLVADVAGATYVNVSDEHGVLDLAGDRVSLGQKLRLIPGHCDPTVNLYDWLVCYRGERVEDVWPIAARGAFY
ncbi:MAG: alanine racemase [Phycisphaerales bacterium]|nr:alanine racemase [Phycisphaerales bacterium]